MDVSETMYQRQGAAAYRSGLDSIKLLDLGILIKILNQFILQALMVKVLQVYDSFYNANSRLQNGSLHFTSFVRF